MIWIVVAYVVGIVGIFVNYYFYTTGKDFPVADEDLFINTDLLRMIFCVVSILVLTIMLIYKNW